ncbi:MAG: CvpA family protein [Phycisphaerales bacterium]|nr:CvpA family protein [Phycisphaerales bacterium]
MALQLVVILIIGLLTLFLANEGAFSALLLLCSSILASTLAMGVYEPASHLMPLKIQALGFARGATFLLVFLLGFSVLRGLFDYFVRTDVALPLWPNRLAGGVLGFFTAMVVVGSGLIGLQMLPLPTSIAGYDRYPSAKGMDEPSSGVWLDPDGFTQGIWELMSGNSLGGPKAFAEVHPDLLRELYGYRNTVQFSDWHTLPANLLKVPFASSIIKVNALEFLGIPDPSNGQIFLVRAFVNHGSQEPDVSSLQSYFRITPTQVRLVTNMGRQYYPIGYLKYGLHFKPVNSQTPIVDDYQPYKGHRRVIENWVFRIGKHETPTLFEMKATARVALSPIIQASAKGTLPTIAASYYPQHPYNNSTMTLTAKIPSGLGPVKFVVLPTSIGMNQMEGLAHDALNRLDQIHHDLDVDHQPAWVNSVNNIKGTPTAAAASQFYNVALRINGTANDGTVSWSDALATLLASQVGQTTDQCRTRIVTYFNNSILPLIKTQSSLIYTTDVSGKIAKPLHVAPGSWTIIAWCFNSDGAWIWMKNITLHQQQNNAIDLGPNSYAAGYLTK